MSKCKRIPADIPRVTYTVPEIAALMGINLVKAYELTRQPTFPAIRLGNRIIVPKGAFHRWLEQTAFDAESSGTV
jgi:excisionase family DNA binding protein